MKVNWSLLENIGSLLTVKGLQYILSFITFPYLVRVLHVDGFGQLAFATGVVQYFLLFSNFGFDLSGPKSIARHDRGPKRGFYFSSIMGAKLFILAVITAVFGILMFILSNWFNYNALLYGAVYLNVIGTALFPIWFFQGIQKMRYITFVSILGRIVSVAGIFIFVNTLDDIVWAAFFQSITNVIAAVFSWIIIYKEYPDILMRIKWCHIKDAIKDSVPYFGSMVAINLYTSSTIVFLGLVTSDYVVGIYTAANRIIDAFRGCLSPVVDALYPFVNKIAKESKERAQSVLRKATIILCSGTSLLCIGIFVTAKWLVYYILGPSYEESVSVLQILAFLPLVVITSNIYGLFGMISFGHQKEFVTILVHSAILDLCIVFPLLYYMGADGAALTMLLTEIYVLYRCIKFVNASDFRFL